MIRVQWQCHLGGTATGIPQRMWGIMPRILPVRYLPFWRERGHRDYFDGCIRDVLQCRRAYRYTLRQSVRHGISQDPGRYRGTRVEIDVERGIRRAVELKAFLSDVPYARYERRKQDVRGA